MGTYALLRYPFPALIARVETAVPMRVPFPTLTAIVGDGFVGVFAMPTLSVSFAGIDAALVLPTAVVSAGIDGGMKGTYPFPALLAVVFGSADVATLENPYGQAFPGWVINMETGAPSRYDEVPANSICRFNGVTYISCAGGIYALNGASDAGRNINAYMLLGQEDFENGHNKRIRAVYTGARATGTMLLKAIATNAEGRYYALTNPGGPVQGSRATLGRGLEGRYWQFRIDNKDGSDFEIDSLEFTPQILKRYGV